jgi:hypothetical protein
MSSGPRDDNQKGVILATLTKCPKATTFTQHTTMVNRTLSFRKKVPPVQRSLSSEKPLIPPLTRSTSTLHSLRRSDSSCNSLDGQQSIGSVEPEHVRKGRKARGPPVKTPSCQLSFRSAMNDSLHSSTKSFKLGESFHGSIMNNSNNTANENTSMSFQSSYRRLLFLLGSILILGLCVLNMYVQASLDKGVTLKSNEAKISNPPITDILPDQSSDSIPTRSESEISRATIDWRHAPVIDSNVTTRNSKHTLLTMARKVLPPFSSLP